MSRSTDSEVKRLANRLFAHCKRLGMLEGDLGKAVVRIKINGYGADLKGLDAGTKDGYTWEQEAIVEAVAAFKRAQAHVMGGGDADGDTFEHADVQKLERALDALDS